MINTSKTFAEHVGSIYSLSLVPQTLFKQEVAQQAQYSRQAGSLQPATDAIKLLSSMYIIIIIITRFPA